MTTQFYLYGNHANFPRYYGPKSNYDRALCIRNGFFESAPTLDPNYLFNSELQARQFLEACKLDWSGVIIRSTNDTVENKVALAA